MINDMKIKKRYVRPNQNTVNERLESYKSDVKIDLSHLDTHTTEEGQTYPIFIDPEYSLPIPNININSLIVSENFEVETFILDNKIHLKLKCVSTSDVRNGVIKYPYIEIILNSYQDLINISENTYTRNGLVQTVKNLDIEDIINKNKLYNNFNKKISMKESVRSLIKLFFKKI